MELEDLGFDGWFRERQEEAQRPDCGIARITRVDRDRYLIRNEENEIQAEPAGKLLFTTDASQHLPCVGDWALVQYLNDNSHAIIHGLLPRKTFLRRKTAGNKVDYQMIASNVDVAFIMQSCDSNFNLRRMERYLVMAKEGLVEPIILLSKTDLVGAEDVEMMMGEIRDAHIGVRIAAFSNTTPSGFDTVRQLMERGKTYCLLGSSGVGKTTLLNRLLGRDAFDTCPVRESDGRGRHTTAFRQLTVLDTNALLIDTPGMREVGLITESDAIDDSFADVFELATQCRFNDCSHIVEAGCAILRAVQNGELDEGRYQNYIKLLKEAAFHQMSYVERRKKDKQFGRTVKTVLKQIKNRKP